VESLRHTGHFGQIISPHRALLTLPLRRRELFFSLLLALVVLAVYVLLVDEVAAGWSVILRACLDWFGFEKVPLGYFGFSVNGYDIYTPFVGLAAGVPGAVQWNNAVIMIIVVLIVSLFLPDSFKPLAYLLRALALIHGIAVLYFSFWPEYFPYSLGGYHALMMMAGMAFIAVVPLVYGLTYFIFDVSLLNKITLTVGTMLYLFIIIPLQYFAHAYLIHTFSLLYMPVLFLMFGIMIDVFLLIAFYALAMSREGKVHPHEHTHPAHAVFPIESE
jgi:hypothetical protein